MSEQPKKKHYITIKIKVLDYWFDWEKKKVNVMMYIGNKLILTEREIK